MDDTDDFIEQRVPARTALAEEQMRLRVAFGDDVARRFLRLRGVEGEPMQEAVLERYAAKQALKLARAALALAAGTLPPRARPCAIRNAATRAVRWYQPARSFEAARSPQAPRAWLSMGTRNGEAGAAMPERSR